MTEVPSADSRIDRCLALTGRDQTECWVDTDRYLMEEIVPWVPVAMYAFSFTVSERVAQWSIEEMAGWELEKGSMERRMARSPRQRLRSIQASTAE